MKPLVGLYLSIMVFALYQHFFEYNFYNNGQSAFFTIKGAIKIIIITILTVLILII